MPSKKEIKEYMQFGAVLFGMGGFLGLCLLIGDTM